MEDRVSFYKQHRIEEQRSWYAKKAASNKGKGKKWFFVLVGTQGGAIVCTLLRVAEPAWDFLPTDVLVVAAASTLGWMQFKRFRELAAAYSLAAQEIGLAREELTHVTDEHEFAHLVTKTENVFSREHTQWAARKF